MDAIIFLAHADFHPLRRIHQLSSKKKKCIRRFREKMACPTWGRSPGQDETRLLVGPAAILGTILAAIARSVRPEGMSIGLKGRRVALAGAGFLAAGTIICAFLAVYYNESCVDSVVIGRTGDIEVTLLQMFWMLIPGVGAAAITSALCTLVATRLSLPRWESRRWKIDHIPRVVRNGVISPRDDYGIGVEALRRYSALWWIAHGTWALITVIMVYTAARGDFTNGLLNLAGLLAVATNTGIPVWNESKIGSGTDSKSKNIDLIRTVETNVVGNFYDNVAAVTTAVRSLYIVPGPPMVLGRTQNYVVANAHAMIADFRSEEMDAGRFAGFGKDPADLARAVVAATLATTKLLSRVLAEADYGDKETELMTISAYMCTIAADSAWAKVQAQRRRLLAVALAIAWSMKITGSLGGKIARTDDTVNTGHRGDLCSCCIHRWTVWRPLQETPNAEMELLFGRYVRCRLVGARVHGFIIK